MLSEIWKRAPRIFGDFYEVSSLGQVKRCKGYHCKKDRILKQFGNKKYAGYPTVILSIHNRHYTVLVHSLVAEAFIGPRPYGKEVNHKDGNRLNASVKNLEYATHEENVIHAERTGLYSRKLTVDKVREIRSLSSTMSQKALVKKFGVNQSTISVILRRKQWKRI